MQTNYADTILNITITGAMVRIDLGTVVSVTNADGMQEGRATQTQQLVMPLDGFVQAFGIQEQVIKKLLADGVLKANVGEGQAPAQSSASSQTSESATPVVAGRTAEATRLAGRSSGPGKKS